jgi:type IV pilus assembly protein PilA
MVFMVKWMKQLRKNEKGLTLIELLAVIVILGIVAAIAIPAIGNIIDDSKDDVHNANALMILNAARLAEASGVEYEDGKMTLNYLVEKGYLSSVPKNPSDDQPYDGANSYVKKENGTYSVVLADSNGEEELKKTEDQLNGSAGT